MKETEKMNRIIVEAKEKSDKKYRQQCLNYSKLKDEVDRLEEELKIAEIMQKTKTSANESQLNSGSLLSELQCIDTSSTEFFPLKLETYESEDDLFSQRYPERRYSYTPNSKVFFKNVFSLETTQEFSLTIPCKIRESRKDPSEEYFILAVQAVKMSSPHMDTICVIPHAALYEKAISEQVPFHKWHFWIESQLNSEYIQKLYRRKSQKLQNFKSFLKKF